MTSNQSEVCHLPVMPVEVAELLVTDPDGAYLDLTAGGGGHLKSLPGRLGTRARLYGIDRDPEAVSRATRALAGTVQFRNVLRTAFGDLEEKAGQFGEESFSGILLDLGLSTNQLFRLLNALGQDVEIVVRATSRRRQRGKLSVHAA